MNLISPNEALNLIEKEVKIISKIEKIKVTESLGFVIASDIISPINFPPFTQSSMDGYAICGLTLKEFEVINEIQAGKSNKHSLHNGHAIRVFTGAALPLNTDAVIPQENVKLISNKIITDITLSKNENVRPFASQIKKNALAIPKNTIITPSTIGFLSMLGVTDVLVYSKPKIGLVITGNELKQIGSNLEFGEVYESNSIMLKNVIKQMNIDISSLHFSQDNLEEVTNNISKSLTENDFVIISGGISVGKFDFVREALKNLNVKEIFYKIKQKPGKPIFFGKLNEKYIFALPGNPASALVCFYIYVLPAILKFLGKENIHLVRHKLQSVNEYTRSSNRNEFLKSKLEGQRVRILDHQNSAMLNSFALADCLVFMPDTMDKINVNDMVEVIYLP